MITGGHRVDHEAVAAMTDDIAGRLGWSVVRMAHPDAIGALAARTERPAWQGAVLLYDLPGLDLRRGAEPTPVGPDAEARRVLGALLRAGRGIVALHHALAGWPAWDGWAEALGGRFLYAPGTVRGVPTSASGYRMATYRVEVLASDHPVCAGIEAFTVEDELYRCAVFDDDVLALLGTDASIDAHEMIDTYGEVRHGRVGPAGAGPGSSLVGWASAAGASPIVYLLPGHGPSTLGHPVFRRLLTNACLWVSGEQARAWATQRARPVPS